EAEVDRLDAVAHHEVGEQVPEDQDQQGDAGQAHEHPADHLHVGAGGGAGARRRDDRRGHQWPPKTFMRWRGRKPAIVTANRATTIHSITRWYRGPWDQKSTSMTRMPL